MSNPLEPKLRLTDQNDNPSLTSLYKQAFPDEDLNPLVKELLQDKENVTSLCAVLGEDDELSGSIIFTQCHANPPSAPLALLGPLAVLPSHQRKGIGRKLINEGIQLMKEKGIAKILVLGDPAFYGRFGFEKECEIETPYPMKEEWDGAWQSICVADGVGTSCSGQLCVAPAWQKKELWS